MPVRAVLERLVGERPADGAVAQRHDLVGDAGIDQRLRADDRSGPAGAIDDDGGVGIGRDVAGAQHQFGAGDAERPRDIHGRIFVRPADIEDRDIRLARDQRADLFRRQ